MVSPVSDIAPLMLNAFFQKGIHALAVTHDFDGAVQALLKINPDS